MTSFLITPSGIDRAYMTEDDLVLIKNGMKEYSKTPSRSVRLHKLMYENILTSIPSSEQSRPMLWLLL